MTNKQFHKDYKKFLKKIQKELSCSSNLKLAFIRDFKEQIKDFLAHFGNPKEISDSFESHNDLSRLHKHSTKI